MSLPSQSSTQDPPRTDIFLLRVQRLADVGWLVEDGQTTRYGRGDSLDAALADYVSALREIAEMGGPIGPPIAREVAWAREVLR